MTRVTFFELDTSVNFLACQPSVSSNPSIEDSVTFLFHQYKKLNIKCEISKHQCIGLSDHCCGLLATKAEPKC